MFRTNSLKTSLAGGKVGFGALLGLGSSAVAELCGQSGCDFVVVDGEHGLGDLATQFHCLQALAATPTTAILRTDSTDPVAIKRALDMGPEAILVPDVRNAEQARAVVAACRYPPRGVRGFAAPLVRASDYGWHTADYLSRVEDELMIIPMIESAEGARCAGAIASVEGIDAVQFGPLDLAYDLGLGGDLTHDALHAVLNAAEQDIRAVGKPIGGPMLPGLSIRDMIGRGYRLLTVAFDTQLLVQGLRTILEQARTNEQASTPSPPSKERL